MAAATQNNIQALVSGGVQMSTKHNKILFLDDDRYEMMPLRDRLESEGYDVSFFSTAEEALAEINSGFRPDVIIVDLKMPGTPLMSSEDGQRIGVKFCRHLRGNELQLTCPIIVLTVVASPKVHNEIRDIVDVIVVKPVQPRELLVHVARVLEQ